MSLFTDQLAAGLATARAIAGDLVTYVTPAGSVPLSATQGQSQFETIDEKGATITGRSVDFLIAAADLVIGNQSVEPAPGHRIEKNGRAYELTYLGDEPCYRWSDPNKTQFRVHTKEVASG